MKSFRLSLASLMGLVVVAAVGVVGLKEGNRLWAALTFWTVVTLILGAIIHGAASNGGRRAALLGFALFAGSYLAIFLADESGHAMPTYPASRALAALHPRLHPADPTAEFALGQFAIAPAGSPISWVTTTPSGNGTLFISSVSTPPTTPWAGDMGSYSQVGNSLAAVLFGLVGAFWAGRVFRGKNRDVTNDLSSAPLAAVTNSADVPTGS